MAWTAPRTWTNGETVDKTILDTHVRDNLSYLKTFVDTRRVFVALEGDHGPGWNAASWVSANRRYYHESTGLSGATPVYFEVDGDVVGDADTFSVRLYDVTAAAEVASSPMSWAGAQAGRKRSADLGALTSAHEYDVQVNHSGGGNTFTLRSARLIIGGS